MGQFSHSVVLIADQSSQPAPIAIYSFIGAATIRYGQIGCASESLPASVAALVAACWPGMSRAQLLDRGRRLGLRISLRARPEACPDGVRLYSLMLVAGEVRTELVVHVRRVVHRRSARRAKASLPPPRDVRQQGVFC